jgi:hypothetical protein
MVENLTKIGPSYSEILGAELDLQNRKVTGISTRDSWVNFIFSNVFPSHGAYSNYQWVDSHEN